MRITAGSAVAGLALLARMPVLLHPQISSDAAVVGLQGLHLWRGELSLFLWSTSYQSSLDALVAGFFSLLHLGPRAVVLGPVLEQVALALVMFRLLRRHLEAVPALIACLPLIVPLRPEANLLAFSATRSLAGLAAVSGAALAEGGLVAPGAALLLLSTGLDLYTVEILPALLLLVPLRQWRRGLIGAALAAAAVALMHVGEHTAVLAPDAQRAGENLRLLWSACLPDAIGAGWRQLGGFAALRFLGGLSFVAALASGAALAPRVPAGVRRLGLAGTAGALCSLAAFVFSSQPQDIESSRYLVALLWTAPLALAPAAHLLGARLAALLSPWLACALVAAGLAMGIPGTLEPLPLDGLEADDRALRDLFHARGIETGAAQYWVAYRLTYLFDEHPVLVPLDRSETRYPPYDALFDRAPRIALIFDPREPRARLQDARARPQLVRAGRYSVLLLDRS